MLAEVRAGMAAAPPFRPEMPRTGKPFSVWMTNFGPLGWVSDRTGGYRYQPAHPVTGEPWPPIPEAILAVWREVARYRHDPEACLVNLYGPGARMGLHQDRDEETFDAPVVSISLGDRARFRLGGTERKDPTASFWLDSGDVLVLEGAARLAFHGIDRVVPDSSTLCPDLGRVNLTLRRVTRP
ncbi:alpha-ketoglutarate-dependent dioxygenase AlkB [Hyphomicrobiales bacterium FT118]|uniref:Alpha-ketoglutarate-dependent dioxygenase AlkB n=2 Tax=Futiania mangrovi TaxID=2959716 RepID=A0A9J6PDG8_9PROT|nr:alpha-ketoglutarate-dependent dioxygenase AlkB [Futiania mangrovii]